MSITPGVRVQIWTQSSGAVMAIVATSLFESFGVRGPALMGAFFGLLGAITITRYQRVIAKS